MKLKISFGIILLFLIQISTKAQLDSTHDIKANKY
jgi:hypothetical protein